MNKDTDVVILVGGLGTRLRPLTLETPKPLLPVAGVPFLQHLLQRIQTNGFRRVILGTSYKAEFFENIFGKGEKLGLEIEYVYEENPLGTGGAIRNVLSKVQSEQVVVCNGDVLSTTDISKVLDFHLHKKAEVTLHLVKVRNPRAFGCVPTDKDGRVKAFLEKTEDPPTNQINAGCYIFNRNILETIPANQVVSVEREVFPRLLEEKARVYAYIDREYWRDMGTPEDFVHGSADIVRGVAKSPVVEHTGEALVHPAAKVHPEAVLIGGTSVGAECEIGPGVRLDGAVLFPKVKIADSAAIERSIISDEVSIGKKTLIRDAVIGEKVTIGDYCEFLRGARIWPEVNIPDVGVRFSTYY